MSADTLALLALLMGLAALLYTMVGHGGASAYLALMALFAVPTGVMRPTALTLNLVAATIATVHYARAGQVNWRLVSLFLVGAVPAAFLGGSLALPPHYYRPLVGVLLWLAAVRLLVRPAALVAAPVTPPRPIVAVPVGAALGLLAGLTGTGGGIFLSPLIILFRWEDTRRTSGIAAAFILLNSAAGLAGNIASVGHLPPQLPWFAGAVTVGALIGSRLGARSLPKARLLQALAVVLVIAGAKLLFSPPS